MEVQSNLFDDLPERRLTIEERFERWLEECPDVFPLFIALALDLKRAGHQKYSSDGICHVIRWHKAVSRGSEPFKINDHFSALLSRKAMDEVPELAGFFELRQRRSE